MDRSPELHPPSALGAPEAAGRLAVCPACGTRARRAEQWCSLCLAPLTPPAPAAASPSTAGLTAPELSTPAHAAAGSSAIEAAGDPGAHPRRRSGRHRAAPADGAPEPADSEAADRLAAQMIAELAAAEARNRGRSRLPGDLMRGRLGRTLIGGVGLMITMLLAFGLLVGLGHLL